MARKPKRERKTSSPPPPRGTSDRDKAVDALMALLAETSGKGEIEADALAAAAGRAVRRHATVLPIRVGRETIRLDVATIDWVDAAGDYMCLHAAGQTHVLRATMKELEEMLDPRLFQRVHRSTIVNLARVAALRPHLNGECFLRLQSGQEIKLSRSYRDKVEMLLDSAGVAPGATLFDVKVLDGTGVGEIGDVLAGIDWVIYHSKEYGIRVLNMSLAADSTESFRTDPLCRAVRSAAAAGITVVVAAGYGGGAACARVRPDPRHRAAGQRKRREHGSGPAALPFCRLFLHRALDARGLRVWL